MGASSRAGSGVHHRNTNHARVTVGDSGTWITLLKISNQSSTRYSTCATHGITKRSQCWNVFFANGPPWMGPRPTGSPMNSTSTPPSKSRRTAVSSFSRLPRKMPLCRNAVCGTSSVFSSAACNVASRSHGKHDLADLPLLPPATFAVQQVGHGERFTRRRPRSAAAHTHTNPSTFGGGVRHDVARRRGRGVAFVQTGHGAAFARTVEAPPVVRALDAAVVGDAPVRQRGVAVRATVEHRTRRAAGVSKDRQRLVHHADGNRLVAPKVLRLADRIPVLLRKRD